MVPSDCDAVMVRVFTTHMIKICRLSILLLLPFRGNMDDYNSQNTMVGKRALRAFK